MDKRLWQVVAWLVTATLIFVTAIVLAASQASGTTTIYYDKQAHSWGFDRAARLWTEQGYRFVKVPRCDGLDPCIEVRTEALDRDVIASTLTYWDGTKDVVVNRVYRGLPLRYRREASCHEFGHVIGQPHQPASCMEATSTGRYTTP